MCISPRMLVAALICSALAACGDADESGTAADNATVTAQGTVTSQAAPPTSGSSLVVSGATVTAPVSSGSAATGSTSGASSLLPPLDPASQIEPSGAAGLPIPAPSSNVSLSGLRVTTYSGPEQPGRSDVGSFRLVCGYSHMAFDDPIVFPGKSGASHLHTFFGNTRVDASSTTESLLASPSSTCSGGTANLSAYWTPALVDSATGRALAPTEFMVYYKKGYNSHTNAEIQAPPNGLRMVGGRSATATRITDADFFTIARFACDGNPWQNTIPACAAGHVLHLSLDFPNCWDGKNLDSPDHRSHMASTNGQPDNRCPASHPVPIAQITVNHSYVVEPGADASRYRLASDKYAADQPGGISFHGDVWVAWNEEIKATWMKNCINAGFDCHAYLLGDGRTLY
jgi:hypothetical protein